MREGERESRAIEDKGTLFQALTLEWTPQKTHLPIRGFPFPLLMVLLTSPSGLTLCATWTNFPFGLFSWKVAGSEENVGEN